MPDIVYITAAFGLTYIVLTVYALQLRARRRAVVRAGRREERRLQ
jgi:heme exporter protein D